jgi:hypothetical protein
MEAKNYCPDSHRYLDMVRAELELAGLGMYKCIGGW